MRKLLLIAACTLITFTDSVAKSRKTEKFEPNIESLRSYECPEWFRDAKFGIWAHWGPQAVPMQGDWYARAMYEPNNKDPYKQDVYDYHVQNYGHPSEFGFKDIIPLWKAEKFDPASLMKLYKAAGAKYFVSMGVHHDNFDLWNSKFNCWNAVEMGPKRDIVGDWMRAAHKEGLKFGVSEHLSAAYSWAQSNKKSDTEGEKKGVPYDGANPQNWDLYFSESTVEWEPWVTNNGMFAQLWYARMTDLLENYQPDLLYSDAALPFGTYGEKMLAGYYNDNMKNNRGKLEAVYLAKPGRHNNGWEQFDGETCVEDRERGGLKEISKTPWQTDTSIGDWFYNENYINEDSGTMYRSAYWVLTTLVDVVSKNGNMLLNVLQRPDGSIDDEVINLLQEIAQWMDINGESIFETRPWLVFGEGPQVRDGGEDWLEDFHYTSEDIRYTRNKKNTTLYATLMGMPNKDITLTKVAECGKKVKSIKLLGSKQSLTWRKTESGIVIEKPDLTECSILPVFKIKWK